MLCSERELLISDEHHGIIEVAGDWAIGTPAAQALGLDDPMIYIKVTPNRPDALGIHGIARDLAAKGLGKLKPLDATPVPGTFDSPIKVTLDFPSGEGKACPLFVGRYFKGVKNGPSPQWLQKRLRAIGLRPISALVDITNYITFSYGRPLHVFDADKVKDNIRPRFAKDGETIAALDGKTYTLDTSMTVIADAEHAEGIAGIIGGEASGCSDGTTNVFLEAAYFDPLRTAATGRKLGINSDARYRFERGVDPAFTPVGAEIATRLILELCGGEASHIVTAGAVPNTARSYTLRKNRVKTLAGIDIPWADQLNILRELGFKVTEAAGGASCGAPSWRPDIQGEADLVEEIARIHGLDNIPFAAMDRKSAIAKPVLSPLQRRMLAARRTLAARGFNEAATWAFLPEAHAKLFGGGQPELKLANPISSQLQAATWRAASAISCSRKSATPTPVIRRNTKRFAREASGAEVLHRAIGKAAPAPSIRSMRKPMRSPSSKPRALPSPRCKPSRAQRHGSTPAAPARSKWARRTSSRFSVKSTRGSSRPWM
jgi:phenylalanyl-tRNA synthetase beta chain